jgi:hypothetical protein
MNRRLLLTLLAIMLVLGALFVPMSAYADRSLREHGSMFVPANATEPYTLTVGGIGVTIPVGALPKGGIIILFVVEDSDGAFIVDFLPEREFPIAVEMDFGSVRDEVVYFHNQGSLVPLRTNNGKLLSTHFSRYSGWH